MRTAKTLIRLCGCPGWSESSLSAWSYFLNGSSQIQPRPRASSQIDVESGTYRITVGGSVLTGPQVFRHDASRALRQSTLNLCEKYIYHVRLAILIVKIVWFNYILWCYVVTLLILNIFSMIQYLSEPTLLTIYFYSFFFFFGFRIWRISLPYMANMFYHWHNLHLVCIEAPLDSKMLNYFWRNGGRLFDKDIFKPFIN